MKSVLTSMDSLNLELQIRLGDGSSVQLFCANPTLPRHRRAGRAPCLHAAIARLGVVLPRESNSPVLS
ncbi:hypothetical protein PVAP13_9KG604101 [Panicum virgatum]|uniref:Uncharacterized protein n=1 Tax=Panicum virgatum TaxID=38727 RepID=A0A8T0P1D6_PANVG|nr:hypothetical protein PVAP13_9KG604101 [Panicum virgatum]